MTIVDLPRIPVAEAIKATLDYLTATLAPFTKALSALLEFAIEWLVELILLAPPLAVAVVVALGAWRIAGRGVGLFTFLGLVFVANQQFWPPMVETLVLVLFATSIAVAVALPVGVASAVYTPVYRVVFPILDVMQTMPAFVYLIPAIPFFGLGPVSALFSTVIFAMPPAIRLTTLGIRQVSEELTEAADAFGATRVQKLLWVQLPLALPTIMQGINQTIMLSLSMVVIAAMIGAGGLGGEVWKAIQRFQPGMGFAAGIAVVIVAIILDRVTQQLGRANRTKSGGGQEQ